MSDHSAQPRHVWWDWAETANGALRSLVCQEDVNLTYKGEVTTIEHRLVPRYPEDAHFVSIASSLLGIEHALRRIAEVLDPNGDALWQD